MKDYLRDYATAAYRYYARCGCPTHEELRDIIYTEALESEKRSLVRIKGIGNPTQQAVINAEAAVDARKGELMDVLAVETAIRIMRPEWIRAVKLVYFPEPERELERGEIMQRVTSASLLIPASERQIYRWLRFARQTFATERGLRL